MNKALNQHIYKHGRKPLLRDICKAGFPYIDNPLLSKFVQEKCNPTVEQAAVFCKLLGVDIYDLYKPEDLDYTGLAATEKIDKPRRAYSPKITVRVSPSMATRIKRQMKALGIPNQREYLEYAAGCIDRYVLNEPIHGQQEIAI